MDLEGLVLEAKNHAIENGVLKKSINQERMVDLIPFTLWPTQFPKKQFDFLTQLQTDFNLLIDGISQSKRLLLDSLQQVLNYDEFTRRLVEIYNEVDQSKQSGITLGISRCDYMLSDEPDMVSPKLVEMNTISVSYMGISPEVAKLHRVLQVKHKDDSYREHYTGEIAHVDSISMISDAMALAWKEYGRPKAVFAMVVKNEESNVFDQSRIESSLALRHHIKMIRCTLSWLHDVATLDTDGRLIVNGTEVAVVYYRSAYHPDLFVSEKDWSAYSLVEKSRAIKCPSISYHLSGSKKIQQVLYNATVLENLISDVTSVQRIRSTFVGQYALDEGPEGDKMIDMALNNPHNYVLKPSREGGGNNYFDDSLKAKLIEIQNSRERTAFILMQRINPPASEAVIIDTTGYHQLQINNEIGIFGVFVKHGEKVLLNSSAGYLIRSKATTQNEAGVSTSGASIDSVALT